MTRELGQPEPLTLGHVKAAAVQFDLALREVHRVMEDIEGGVIDPGAKVKLTLELTFEPSRTMDGVEITCVGHLKLPKYLPDGVYALRRLGGFKVLPGDQAELPGIRGVRLVDEHETSPARPGGAQSVGTARASTR